MMKTRIHKAKLCLRETRLDVMEKGIITLIKKITNKCVVQVEEETEKQPNSKRDTSNKWKRMDKAIKHKERNLNKMLKVRC
jgi:nickel-dependent lactate racemase